MVVMKLLGKIIALPMILVLTILFYVVTILSRIYGLAAIAFNLAIMLCAIIALVLQQWNNFGIAVAILVISYLIMGAWDVIAGMIVCARDFSPGYYLDNAESDEKITEKHRYNDMFCSYCDTRSDIVERNKS